MGDLPPGSAPQSLNTTADALAPGEHQNSSFRSPNNNSPFHAQHGSIPQGQGRPDIRSPGHAANAQFPAQDHGASPLNMGAMAGALPEYASMEHGQGNLQPHPQPPRPLSGASTSALVYHLQQNLQPTGQPSGPMPTQYAPGQYQQNFTPSLAPHPNYAHYHPNQQRMAHPSAMQAPYQGFPQPPHYMYYPSPYSPQGQLPQGFQSQHAQQTAIYGRRPSLPNAPMPMMGQNMEFPQSDGVYPPGVRGMPGTVPPVPGEPGPMASILGGTFGGPSIPSGGPISSIPRGPPRKPKQSGHALWVGNLPPGTTVVALKDHFSRDATKDIESLFLISKSNCAFVNYRTEASCTAAMHRFHDSRFNGVRLVCRLRRSSAPASGVPTGPSAMAGSQPANTSPPRSPQDVDGVDGHVDGEGSPTRRSGEENRQASTAKDKYFIVKSLTLQDLELSVRNGIWATQSHNEEVFNKAYESAENVYLIFSANKSGEYFGYARMASPILSDAAPAIEPKPKPEVLDTTDVPKSIPTPATEFAPKGRIIDDSARGTIFWEADLSDGEEVDGVEKEETQQTDGELAASGVAQSWGKPFKIEWISTNRLPFYRTRGLRNPWNANREVKIARDGTELETSVGERLVQMFHRLGPSTAGAGVPGGMQPPTHQQMRPYGA